MKPIYTPSGAAKEYGDYAINIYTGCNHGCTYCYAAKMSKRFGKDFTNVEAHKGIVEAVKRQLDKEQITDKLIHLCFTCDPYPAPPIDTTSTREIIKAIKESGNHVQILTKGGSRAMCDFDLLDSGDWFGVTISGANSFIAEPNAAGFDERINGVKRAKRRGVNTWVSFEPVYEELIVYSAIKFADFIDKYKIGKLNYHASDIKWAQFGRECERLCLLHGRNYYIKESLRKEMETGT